MLLAAGRSTRLGALGAALPKPLLPICGHAAVMFGLHACARAGLGRVVVNLHHHGDLIRRALDGGGATGVGVGVQIAYSDEPELLGTGGGIARARALFAPLATASGYIPIATLVPLTMSWFGTEEKQKVIFLGMAFAIYLLPLVMLNTDNLYPWPLGIMVYQGEYSAEWNLILAFITLTILPTILLFLLAQRHIVAGLTAGAVKG